MIEVQNVTKNYGNFKALTDISLTLTTPFTVIVGKSGSGKSTLLHAIGSLDNDYEGTILVNGENIKKENDKAQANFRNTTLGFVFQKFYLEPNYTVFENVLIPLLVRKMKKKDRTEAVNKALKRVGLLDKAKNKAKNISGGEMQRVAIARAIVTEPKIILADEPTGNLDTENGNIVMQIFKDLAKDGCEIVCVTHNKEHIAYGDKVIYLKDGKIDRQE